MPRYIDADRLIEFCLNNKSRTVDANDIARFPCTADVVEVVRCQDCKYHESIKMANGHLSFCRKHRLIDDLMCSDFCSDGERRNKTNE